MHIAYQCIIGISGVIDESTYFQSYTPPSPNLQYTCYTHLLFYLCQTIEEITTFPQQQGLKLLQIYNDMKATL